MIFTATALEGVYVIEPEQLKDHRGFFARTWCQREFDQHGLETELVQCSISFNEKSGTLRGMHYQTAPFQEVKVVRCTMGSIVDVIIDLRPDSPSFKMHFAIMLSAQNRKMLYIPKGFAHGFQILEDHSEIFYQMNQFYASECARGIRWDDPAFGIRWPMDNPIMHERDRTYADFREEYVPSF